jgi:hypothetical protein
MNPSSENLVPLEAKPTQVHRSHQRSRRRLRIAARIALILGLLIAVLAVSNFVFSAYRKSNCYFRGETTDWGFSTPGEPMSDECREEIISLDEYQRLDAAALVLAVALLSGSALISRRVRKHRR